MALKLKFDTQQNKSTLVKMKMSLGWNQPVVTKLAIVLVKFDVLPVGLRKSILEPYIHDRRKSLEYFHNFDKCRKSNTNHSYGYKTYMENIGVVGATSNQITVIYPGINDTKLSFNFLSKHFILWWNWTR